MTHDEQHPSDCFGGEENWLECRVLLLDPEIKGALSDSSGSIVGV